MFKPQKPQQQQNQPTRQRLPMVDRPPRQEDIAALFTNAMRIRGCSFELPIRPSPMLPPYLVCCQFDPTSNETVWSMYEGESGSVPLFNCPQSDLDLVFDMVCMGCQSQAPAQQTQLPPELQKAQPSYNPTPAPAQAPPGQQPPQPYGSAYQQQQQQQQHQQQQQPYPAHQQYPPAGQPAPYPQTGYPQQPTPQPYPPQAPYPAQAYPPQPYQAAPAQQGYPQAQAPYYPGAAPAPAPYPAAAPYQAPPAPTPTPAPAPQISYDSGLTTPSPQDMTNFLNLIDKGTPNLLLGHLLTEAGMVPQPCLDAALKCQELVRNGKLTNEQAVRALKRASELGGILDEDVIAWARDPEGARARSRAAQPNVATGQMPRDNPGILKVLELLKQAGLVSDADLETAKKVRSKHGGDLGQILVSAGKVGAKTLEAANQCQEFVTNGRLRIDKAIMALHYCERMRVGLKDAFEELSIEMT